LRDFFVCSRQRVICDGNRSFPAINGAFVWFVMENFSSRAIKGAKNMVIASNGEVFCAVLRLGGGKYREKDLLVCRMNVSCTKQVVGVGLKFEFLSFTSTTS
jgi:hypothetical protein